MPLSDTLSLSLLKNGASMIGTGLLYGFLIPIAPFPRLALTAHTQFVMEGMFVLCAGLVLQSKPAGLPKDVDTLAQSLGKWQTRLVYWGATACWIPLTFEALNAWWGTRQTLSIAAEAAHILTDGRDWQETVMFLAHIPPALSMATLWPVIVWKLFSLPGARVSNSQRSTVRVKNK
ncbi:hypothetical protein PV05_08174 [Exophiala xenobiotica]|uniref:Uncharacterized protein n=1 Tax=Exophiala xenobiotica TaxID=348802 RepID=A0A0D2EXM3_9EURO|nr:uncharacterized protein PV05_08174 [Exophiala xenobiotica]KIW52544.1 hypothetical protein PV05_08174 [Exophiala xenobiotica]